MVVDEISLCASLLGADHDVPWGAVRSVAPCHPSLGTAQS